MEGLAIVEGYGEIDAVEALLARLWADLGHGYIPWRAVRGKNLLQREGVEKYAEVARRRPRCAALLLLRDADDDCPKQTGPLTAGWLRDLGLPFPGAVTLFRREYETMFLPCLPDMAGRPLRSAAGIELPGIRAGAEYLDDYETPRDAKGVVSTFFTGNRSYKPTVHQLPLTRMLNFARLRESELPSFGTLERSLVFLAANAGHHAVVYPPPSVAGP
ncbi:MAG TPA: hypothetical protein VE913_13935 [Longimicrobium sp.]|nr:hypothetical protein [Longimicrobium sp.]